MTARKWVLVAGILVTLMLPISLLVHLIRVFLFADTSDKDNFDRKMLHNALTAVRERDTQIKVFVHDLRLRILQIYVACSTH